MTLQPPVVQPFEANGFPLDNGVQLLEASAGTGKTFALAHLVLRLVCERQLALEQLLVVTFTEAAAAELRDRIAQRLQQALALLEQPGSTTADPVLLTWLAAHPELKPGPLLLALEQLDRADITTIHGFCRRTLQRRALEAGLGPAVELESDDGERRRQVCHDYWQQQLLPLPAPLLAGLELRGLKPALLEQHLKQLDSDPALGLDPLPPGWSVDEPLGTQLQEHWLEAWAAFAEEWNHRGEALEHDLCSTAAELKALGGGSTTPYVAKPRSNRVAQVNHWLAAQAEPPGYDAVLSLLNGEKSTRERLLLDYFHPSAFCKATSALEGEGRSLPQAPLLEAIAGLVDAPAELTLLHSAHWGRRELRQRRSRSGRMGFGELLEGLDPGEQPDAAATSLLQALRDRYRVALIDEFQDTDPIQWRILEQAFATGDSQRPASHLLVMVGDPKQAIYRFRGGELATYRLARDRAGAIHGLFENRRSSAALVAGLNALMAPGLVRSQLEVPPVQARADKGELVLPEGEATLQLLPLRTDQLPQQVSGLCLQLLQRRLLLRQGGPGEPVRQRPLEPNDLCLLVSSHRQAEELRRALEQRGLPSRLVSRGDVFASEGATGLQRLLDALADPGSPNRQRLLAASPLLGWSAETIASAPEQRWDALADQLSRLAAALPRQGLMAALGQLLNTEGMARLALGGRVLADIQQAAELVQERLHREGLGAAAAADWLRRLRLDPDREVPEAHQLNSDAADSAIAVVTVHRSKGLEYPVVVCPYLWRAPKPTVGVGRRWRPPGRSAPRLDLHLSPHWGVGRLAFRDQQEAEEQERERLAYVAATRARHLLVLGWMEAKGQEANPLAGWLLTQGQRRELPLHELDPDQLPGPEERWQAPKPGGTLEVGPRPLQTLDTTWGRSSYSAWAHSASPLAPQITEEGRDTDALSSDGAALPGPGTPWPAQGPLAQFPRGAGPGDALHRILERIDYQTPADSPETASVVAQELQRAGLDPVHQQSLLAGIEQLRLSPMGGALGAARLADLPRQQRLNEMNFDLPLAVPQTPGPRPALIRASGLARAFAQHPGGLFGARYAGQLAQLEVASRGFLTGSIDLVFRWGERWWVADWKSNWLGVRDAGGQPLACGPLHYGQDAMAQLMEQNHYPLQAHLYLVALHRYLRWRLPEYDAARHLGGYAYVFLRGVPGPLDHPCSEEAAVPGMLVEQPPLQRVLALDTLLREGQP